MDQLMYDEQVKVSTEADGYLGTGRFSGSARRDPRGGFWSWRGQLLETSFEPGMLAGAKVHLDFEDGAVGEAICTNVSYSARRGLPSQVQVDIMGNSLPPRVTA